mmetsp:Transcript_17096/g.22929  ORF Transcript_17096/g.22929 Transcript_17096/m.22929 type:complete len:203 (-) Transcript_17096:120-728(-)
MTARSSSNMPSSIVVADASTSALHSSENHIMMDTSQRKVDPSGCPSSPSSVRTNCPAHLIANSDDSVGSVESILLRSRFGQKQRQRRSDNKVNFPASLVSDVRERPRTAPEEKAKLYHSSADVKRFRQEARLVARARAEAARQRHLSKRSWTAGSSSLSSLLPVPLMGVVQTLTKPLVGVLQNEVHTDSSNSSMLVDSLYLF